MAIKFVNAPFFIAPQCGVVSKAEGLPGVGKSAVTNMFAKIVGRKMYTLIGSLRDPADIGGYPFLDREEVVTELDEAVGPQKSEEVFMRLVPPKWAKDCLEGKWIIFIDELTTCPPAVQAAFLRVMTERVVGDLQLPEDTWIVSCCNPTGIAANGFDLEPPMANRLMHCKWETDFASWRAGMMNGGNFPAPKFPIVPEDWKNELPRVGSEIAAFQQHKPEVFEPMVDSHGQPTMSRSEMSGPWPSIRSWDYAKNCLAACEATPELEGDETVAWQMVRGCVGDGAANEFFEWRRKLDLPDPEEMIKHFADCQKAGIEPQYNHPNRPDKVMAMLGAISYRIKQDNSLPRFHAAMSILDHAARKEFDVAFVCAKQLLDDAPTGYRVDDEFAARYFPAICRVMDLKPGV